MSRKKILVMSYSHLDSDPRVRRQIQALSPHYEILTAGLSPLSGSYEFYRLTAPGDANFKLIDFHLRQPLPIRKFLSFFIILYSYFLRKTAKPRRRINLSLFKTKFLWKEYWDKKKQTLIDDLKGTRLDAVLANDVHALPVASVIAEHTGAKLIFDAHEYSPGENDSNPDWVRYSKPLLIDICKTYFPKVALMYSVCQGIADEYEKNFGKSSLVITNATDYHDLHPGTCEEGKIRMVHHGAAIAQRHLEEMIKLMDLLDDRFTLDLILVPTHRAYLKQLELMITNRPRVRILPPVRTEVIPVRTNQYDVGLFFLPPVNTNYYYALPNKFFEFIQARLAIAIGPNPEMKKLVDTYELGVVADSFELQDLATKLNALDHDQIKRFKENAHRCAPQLNSSKNAELMLESIGGLLPA